jgi:hypothetical protein
MTALAIVEAVISQEEYTKTRSYMADTLHYKNERAIKFSNFISKAKQRFNIYKRLQRTAAREHGIADAELLSMELVLPRYGDCSEIAGKSQMEQDGSGCKTNG